MRACVSVLVLISAVVRIAFAGSAPIPRCRLDDSRKDAVMDAITRARAAYEVIGKPLPFDRVRFNPESRVGDGRTLTVYVVMDANRDGVTPEGCATGLLRDDEPLDSRSVRGGCVVVAGGGMEIRCSGSAVGLFTGPSLLYLLSHELAHVYQRLGGQYAGNLQTIDLDRDQASKLRDLRDSCDPVVTRREEEADAMAVEVLQRLLQASPYRQPILSEQGSMLWNIDRLALASDAWRSRAAAREFISRATPHPAFVPTEFPTPVKQVEANGRRFVCDVLTRRKGTLAYPSRSTSHPAVEQRLRKITEALKPVADRLPATGGERGFEPIARLQQDVSPILSHIYRETGVYLESVQDAICTMVNGPDPASECR